MAMAVISSTLGTMPRRIQSSSLSEQVILASSSKGGSEGQEVETCSRCFLFSNLHLPGLASEPEELFPVLPAHSQEKLCSG